jgi:hypothetical protein
MSHFLKLFQNNERPLLFPFVIEPLKQVQENPYFIDAVDEQVTRQINKINCDSFLISILFI